MISPISPETEAQICAALQSAMALISKDNPTKPIYLGVSCSAYHGGSGPAPVITWHGYVGRQVMQVGPTAARVIAEIYDQNSAEAKRGKAALLRLQAAELEAEAGGAA